MQMLNDKEMESINGGANNTQAVFSYEIQQGDCLSVLAQRYGTTVQVLVQLNGIKDPNKIYAGSKILIPYKG